MARSLASAESDAFPSGDLGLSAERQGRVAAGLAGAQRRDSAMRPGGGIMVDVAQQETCVRQQLSIDAEQLPGLSWALPSAVQQGLHLPVNTRNIREHGSWRQLGMRLRKCCAGLVEVYDHVIAAVAGSYPCGETGRVLLRGDRQPVGILVRLARRRRPEERVTGEPECPAVQFGVKVSGKVKPCLICPDVSLDARDIWQDGPSLAVGRVPEPDRRVLLAPQPAGPLLTQADGPRR
jgi:hypothetical protein